MKNWRPFVFYNNRKVEETKLSQTLDKNARETSKFIQSDATKFIILLALLLANTKTDAFYWLKSDRSTFQIFCSRSLRQLSHKL